MTLRFEPLTRDRWDDLEELFGRNGAFSGCWCMWWRITAREFELGNASNKAALEELVAGGTITGLIAYDDGAPVGWVAVGPRGDFPRIERSTKLKPIDDEPAWAVPCFFVHRRARGTGLAAKLLDAAVRFARSHGARLVEGYPIADPERYPTAADLYTGTTALFARAGFEEASPRGKRTIVRKGLRQAKRGSS